MHQGIILWTKIMACSAGQVNTSAIQSGQGGGCASTGLPTINAGPGELNQILTLTFATLAAISVLFIVIGGLKLVTSNGNPEGVTKARNTMLYAVIGLIVAIFAEAIVNFALKFIQ